MHIPPLIWGIWQDSAKNVYAAVFSDKTIKKIDHSGNITTVYTSKENWSPLHGTFGNNNKLWVLEGADNNDVRVMSTDMVLVNSPKQESTKSTMLPYIIIGGLVLSIGILYLKTKNKMYESNRRNS